MKKMFVILTVLILSVGFFACDNGGGGGGGGSEKILIVNNVTDDLLQTADSDMGLGIYPVGTSLEDALDQKGLVAGAGYYDISDSGISPNIVVTVELYSFPFGNDKRWTGSGTYDVFMILNGNGDGYIKRNVSIASETTYLDATSFDDKIEDGEIVE